MENEKKDFDVIVASRTEDDTVVLTTSQIAKHQFDKAVRNALSTYNPDNRQYSAFLEDTSSSEDITVSRIDELAEGLQTSLSNILTVNSVVQTYINKNDLIGITYDAIEANINTEFKCSYKKFPEQRNKTKTVSEARSVIDDFCDQINVKRLLRTAIPIAYAEGTYIAYLRQKDENWIVDYYPLGVAEISDYLDNGRPIVLINIAKLKTALNKTMLRDRKRKPLFFEKQEEEVKANFPDEVYQAYVNNDTYAKLDVDRCGVIRIGNIGRKYGVTPFFRALKPALMLETFDNSDRTNARARQKKIIWQKLDNKLMGENGERNGYEQQAYAHENLMSAWKQSTVVVTTPPYVESIEYVEPEVEMTNIETVLQYRNREMAALGISFLNSDGTQTVSTATISLNQLMKNIDKLCEQFSDVMKQWFRVVLKENNIGYEYCPNVRISASEMMSTDMKRTISNYLFSTLGCSYGTAMSYLGIDVEDERVKREAENDAGYSEIFAPRQTAYTNSSSGGSSGGAGSSSGGGGSDGDGESKTGRPASDQPTEKQAYDKQRNDAKKALQT